MIRVKFFVHLTGRFVWKRNFFKYSVSIMGTACTCQAPVPVQIDKGATILSSKDAGQIILSWTQLADFGDIKELALHFFEQ